jgi:hypothetical protein
MRKLALWLLALLLLQPVAGRAETAEVSSNDLIENALALDGQTVVYSGEVIGDIMKRGDYTWLNVSDGSNAMGVWVETALLGDVATPGRYGMHGDEVRVTGVFHRACAEHGGDMDIHAEKIELLGAGYPVSHGVQLWKLVLTLVFTSLSATAVIVM